MASPESTPTAGDHAPGKLLEELAWLQDLARRVVRDGATADDLVQETWLAALRRFGRSTLPSREWLSSRLRSSAWNRRRGDRRRARREEETAPRKAAPSTEELVLRSEAQRRLLAAMLELPEELHTALVMRFSDGLTVTEIARRQSCAKSTASERIERGLGALRERLGENRQSRAWSACLLLSRLPDMRRPFAPVTPGPTVLGSLLVSKKLILVAAATIALVAFIAGRESLARLVGRGASSPVAALDAPQKDRVPTDARSALDEPVEPPRDALRVPVGSTPVEVVASDDDYVLHGVVTAADASPLAGVSIRMLEGEREHKVSHSEPNGAFELRLSPAELDAMVDVKELRVRIVARDDREQRQFEFSDTDHADFPLPRSGSTDRLPPILLPRASAIEGRVRDDDGDPVAGAIVSLHIHDEDQSDGIAGFYGPTGELEAETGPDGAFQLLGVPPGDYLVEAEHMDFHFLESYVPATCALGERARGVEIELRRAEYLTGRVEDVAGNALADVYLSAHGFTRRGTVQSNADGRFAVPLRDSGPYKLRVSALGYEHVDPSIEERRFESGTEDLAIVMRAWEPTTVFQLLDAETRATVDLAACVLREVEPHESLRYFLDDNLGAPRPREDGLVRSRAVPGEDALVVDAPGYVRRAVRVAHDSSFPPHQIVELQPASGIRGRLLMDGEPLRGARVRLHGVRFRLNEPRFARSNGALVASDAPRMDMSTLGLTSYELQGVVGLDGMPPEYRTIPWSRILGATRSDADGRFQLDRSHTGLGFLSVEDDAGALAYVEFEGVPLATGQDLGDLHVQRSATITGRVDLGGLPRERPLRVELEALDLSCDVSPTGEFRLEGLPPGDVYLQVDELERGDTPYLVREPAFHVRLAPGEHRDVVLPIANWLACRLETDITVGGKPAPRGAMLQARPIASARPFHHSGGITDSNGRIEDHVPAEGLCAVQLHMPQSGAWPGKLQAEGVLLDLQPGGFVDRDIDFPASYVTLRIAGLVEADGSTYLDVALEDTGGGLGSQTIRHIPFQPSPDDPAVWQSTTLVITPGRYTATLFRHDTTPRTEREDDVALGTADADLRGDARQTVTFDGP